ncbi:hypothetical protein CTI12_AA104240 [Artemisia annua]|uniref:Zinc knuckle CX2CX4HX4C n=1 Tax=Artemisia annua TaxID=35608 RepID=A0A2U1PFX9_ARTAN|nr:hypothetical protein CTI12_AA104240 [Artemisia annua]
MTRKKESHKRMTTAICEKPYGRASFARVLVEIDSSNALVDNVELWYKSLGKILKLWVEYTWVPPRCEECKVYGHYLSECAKKVNTVSKVNKDGENVKAVGVTKSTSNGENKNGEEEEGWQTAGNRRNMRNGGYNTRQGPVGGYNAKRGSYNDRGGGNNRSNVNVGGTRVVQKKTEPVNTGSVGKVDESVVANDRGEPANKDSSKVNIGNASTNGKSKSVNGDQKLNMANKNSGNKNGNVSTNGNKNNMGSNSSDGLSSKNLVGDKPVATSNRFDLLSEEGVSESNDPWKVVKELVTVACNTSVPINKDILKGWNDEMVKFYTVKWNNRASKSGSIKLQLETEMKSLVHQIVQLNRNLNMNAKVNAEKMLKSSGVNNQSSSGVSLSKPVVLMLVCWFCLGTGLWKCNKVFDRGEICLTISYALQRIGLASALACFLGVWSLASYALQNRIWISALAVLFWIMRSSDQADGVYVYWVCSFRLSTGLWECNQIFEQGEGILCNLLCTTEGKIAFCAGHWSVGSGYTWLRTTGTDLNFCAVILFWIRSRFGQTVSVLLSCFAVEVMWERLVSIDWVCCFDDLAFHGILKSAFGFLLLWLLLHCYGISAIGCNFPLFSLSISAFYELYSYGDVWRYIGWSLCKCPCIQSMGMVLDQAYYYAKTRIGLASALACFLGVWSLASYALQNRTWISALAVLFWIMRSSDQADGVYVYWVCSFRLSTGLWECNQIFERGEGILCNLLCTTEGKIAFCAGHWSVGCGYTWLCTTGTDLNFCAGILFWIRSRFGQTGMALIIWFTVFYIGWVFSMFWFGYGLFWDIGGFSVSVLLSCFAVEIMWESARLKVA